MTRRPSPAASATAPEPSAVPGLGLGLDVGGTHTRWALAAPGEPGVLASDELRVLAGGEPSVLACGQVPGASGWSGVMLHSPAGREHIAQVLADVAAATVAHGRVARVQAGVTGFDAAQLPVLAPLLVAAFGLPVAAVGAMNDVELACHAAFAPGEGFVLMAGTGSVAAFIDGQGRLQRAGGRGAVIDDAGGGHWIASQALRAVWRAEDEAPGAWQQSLLARRLFDALGGSDWAVTRHRVYGASRGELGTLAVAVAAAAEQGDAVASGILDDAGRELARLVLALARRCGPRPVALAGRVFDLHPRVATALRAALQAAAAREAAAQPALAGDWATLADAQPRPLLPHHAAARLAAAAGSAPSA